MDFARMLSTWKDILFHPLSTIEREAARTDVSILDGLVPYLVALVVVDLLESLTHSANGLVLFPLLLVLGTAASLALVALVWLVSRFLLGGQVSYARLYYMYSCIIGPFLLISALFMAANYALLVAIVDFNMLNSSLFISVSLLLIAVLIVLCIYFLALYVIAVKKLYGFQTWRALAAVLIPIVIEIVLVAIVVLFIFVAVVSRMTGHIG